jgi:hypothetical protein
MAEEDLDGWLAQAREAWVSTAPSYVQHDVPLLDGHLRDWHDRGMTVTMFREALEIAFTQHGVTKRNALPYAFGIVRRRLND